MKREANGEKKGGTQKKNIRDPLLKNKNIPAGAPPVRAAARRGALPPPTDGTRSESAAS